MVYAEQLTVCQNYWQQMAANGNKTGIITIMFTCKAQILLTNALTQASKYLSHGIVLNEHTN